MKLTFFLAIALFIAAGPAGALPLMPWQDADRELLKALKDNDPRRFEALLKQGANPNAFFKTKRGDSEWVMCDATGKGKFDFLKLAVQHGGNVNIRNPDDWFWPAPIFCAIKNYSREAYYFLASHGADLTMVDQPTRLSEIAKDTPLTDAARGQLWDVVYWTILKRQGQISDAEIRALIKDIERTGIKPNTEENVFRFKVAEYLMARGYAIKPAMGELKCQPHGRRKLPSRTCKNRGAKPGDIIYTEDPELHRKDWERAKTENLDAKLPPW